MRPPTFLEEASETDARPCAVPGYHLPFLSRSRQPESGRPLASQSSPQPPPLAAFEKPDSRRPGMPSGQSTSKYGGETDRMSID